GFVVVGRRSNDDDIVGLRRVTRSTKEGKIDQACCPSESRTVQNRERLTILFYDASGNKTAIRLIDSSHQAFRQCSRLLNRRRGAEECIDFADRSREALRVPGLV